MKIFDIRDVSGFFGGILECAGNVYYRDENGDCHDLKELAARFTGCKWPFQPVKMNEIDVVVEKSDDCMRLYRYMLNARP